MKLAPSKVRPDRQAKVKALENPILEESEIDDSDDDNHFKCSSSTSSSSDTDSSQDSNNKDAPKLLARKSREFSLYS